MRMLQYVALFTKLYLFSDYFSLRGTAKAYLFCVTFGLLTYLLHFRYVAVESF